MKQRTPKQQKFLDKWIETGNLAEAAEYAGSKAKSRKNLSKCGRAIYETLRISFTDLMEEIGIDDLSLIKKLKVGLNSTKVISCNIINVNKDGMKDADSMTKDFIDVEDFPTQHKFLETALKLKGHLKDKVEHTGKDGSPLIPVPNLLLDFGDKKSDPTA